MIDKNCMTYWFPRLECSGANTPRTILIRAPKEIYGILDGWGGAESRTLAAMIRGAIEARGGIGTPAFLRTGHTAGKHDWSRTCCVRECNDDMLMRHIYHLAEACAMADLPGQVFAVRQFLRPEALLYRLRRRRDLRRHAGRARVPMLCVGRARCLHASLLAGGLYSASKRS